MITGQSSDRETYRVGLFLPPDASIRVKYLRIRVRSFLRALNTDKLVKNLVSLFAVLINQLVLYSSFKLLPCH